jgi:hypothetical protein
VHVSNPRSKLAELADAQSLANAAEQYVAHKAALHATGAGPAPSTADIKHAGSLRSKATALLTSMLFRSAVTDPCSGCGPANSVKIKSDDGSAGWLSGEREH